MPFTTEAHEFPHATISAGRTGCRAADYFPPRPACVARETGFQFADVSQANSASHDAAQSARTYFSFAAPLSRGLSARVWLCAPVSAKTNGGNASDANQLAFGSGRGYQREHETGRRLAGGARQSRSNLEKRFARRPGCGARL